MRCFSFRTETPRGKQQRVAIARLVPAARIVQQRSRPEGFRAAVAIVTGPAGENPRFRHRGTVEARGRRRGMPRLSHGLHERQKETALPPLRSDILHIVPEPHGQERPEAPAVQGLRRLPHATSQIVSTVLQHGTAAVGRLNPPFLEF